MRKTLRSSHLTEARALRVSGEAGRRFQGLDVLAKAAAIRPGPDLRDEAIAAMALTVWIVSEVSVRRNWLALVAIPATFCIGSIPS